MPNSILNKEIEIRKCFQYVFLRHEEAVYRFSFTYIYEVTK